MAGVEMVYVFGFSFLLRLKAGPENGAIRPVANWKLTVNFINQNALVRWRTPSPVAKGKAVQAPTSISDTNVSKVCALRVKGQCRPREVAWRLSYLRNLSEKEQRNETNGSASYRTGTTLKILSEHAFDLRLSRCAVALPRNGFPERVLHHMEAF